MVAPLRANPRMFQSPAVPNVACVDNRYGATEVNVDDVRSLSSSVVAANTLENVDIASKSASTTEDVFLILFIFLLIVYEVFDFTNGLCMSK
jgi:hypothetical protein